ncbi:MAG: ATP-dependent RNA helicase HrpA [Gammaproteobacteria bacterium]|nr:ATP-dependent RNA helicase HrpA [Gammaproteobacteria bacterium]
MTETNNDKPLLAGRLPLDDCWQADARKLVSLKKRKQGDKLKSLLDRSLAKVQARRDRLPKPEFPDELPVSHKLEDIAKAMDEHQVIVVCGETGSGKSTQLPKLMLELGRGTRGMIAHTQPRRVAARTIAKRLSDELGTELGNEVGYKIRFNDRISADSYIKVLTDGMLLAEIQNDRWLDQYDTLIIDEAHERSLNIDFLLGYLKRVLEKRPDLKVIITSATIDPDSFSKHFDDAPIIMVSGRTYPVEVLYRPLVTEDEDEDDLSQTEGIVQAVRECWNHGPGDILVFLSGEREIRETAEALRKRYQYGVDILPLFSRLSASDQDKVFNPKGQQRIVLATNVAETSLTVPRIRYVIDPGKARISRYSARSKVQRLPIEKVSQASANQRKGRCGRISEGVCVRLYSEEDFETRPEFTDPEIHRTNLASVILQMKLLGFGDIEEFPFLSPPDDRYISDGYRLLAELQAVDDDRNITKLGREIAKLPVDPRLARILLAAAEHHCLRDVLVIIAVLAIQDPRERPMEKAQAADNAHAEFDNKDSDFLTFITLWNAWKKAQKEKSGSQLRKWCKENFLAFMRMREWQDIHRQLSQQLKEQGYRFDEKKGAESSHDEIHRAIVTGFLSQCALREEEGWYQGARNLKFRIFPGSALFSGAKKGGGPKWIVAGEVVETGQMWARKVAKIEPRWLEEAGAHLLNREYVEPHWEAGSGRVAAYENATLYGLPIVQRRRVNYGPMDPQVARGIFIREGLVHDTLEGEYGFLEHNRELREGVEDLEARVRRRDILVDDATLEALYAERLPDEVYDGITFRKWYRRHKDEAERSLRFTREDVLARSPDDVDVEQFPESLVVNGMPLPLEYHFDPVGDVDGVLLEVPVELLGQVSAQRVEWLVPGFIEEKMTALIRALPKALRRNFVPAPDFARAARESLEFGKGDLKEELCRQLIQMTGTVFEPDAWLGAEIPDHLVMNIRVIDADGETLAVDDDIRALQQRFAGRATQQVQGLEAEEWPEIEASDWEFGEIPENVSIKSSGRRVKLYPALQPLEEEGAVAVLATTPIEARHLTHEGILALLQATLRKEVKFARKNLPDAQAICLKYQPIGPCEELKQEIVDKALRAAAGEAVDTCRNEAAFRELQQQVRAELQHHANRMGELVAAALDEAHGLRKQLKGRQDFTMLHAMSDIQAQLDDLVFRGFVEATPDEWLPELPRFLQGIRLRLERIGNNPGRDKSAQQAVEVHEERLAGLGEQLPDLLERHEELLEYRWMLEEYRVSLFAQELGTRVTVSEKRMNEQWQRARKAMQSS